MSKPDPLDAWLDTQDDWYRTGFYKGMAKAREEHALEQVRKGTDSDALKHMKQATEWENRARVLRRFLMGEAA